MRRMPKLKIKAGVWQWLALASGCVGMMFGLGFAGEAEALGNISDVQFATAMALLLAAMLFIRLGDAAEKREKAEAARRKRLRRYAADTKHDSRHSA